MINVSKKLDDKMKNFSRELETMKKNKIKTIELKHRN
jgi:hypothetical protein